MAVGTGAWRMRAANFFFMIIVFGMPLFSVPCSKGKCTYPLEVIADYLYSRKLASDDVVKGLLYPNALLSRAESIVADNKAFSLPSWETILTDRSFVRNESGTSLAPGFVLGCILCLVGALVSALGPSILSGIGMLIVFWYVYSAGSRSQLHPTFVLAIFCSVVAFDFEAMLKRWRPAAAAAEPSAAAVEAEASADKKTS